jgi:hypothetical protein
MMMGMKKIRKRSSQHLYLTIVLVILVSCASLVFYHEQAHSDSRNSPDEIPHAVGLFVTKRGQKLINDKFDYILHQANVEWPETVKIPDVHHTMDKPLELDEWIKNSSPEFRKKNETIIQEIRQRIREWLHGLDLKKPIFDISSTDMSAQFHIARLGVLVDPKFNQQFRIKEGLVAIAEISANRLMFKAPNIRIRDQVNDFLGTMGVDDLKTSLPSRSEPLQAYVPVHIKVGPEGNLIMTVLDVTTNIKNLGMVTQFSNLVLPKITIGINGHQVTFDELAFEDDMRDKLPSITKAGLTYLATELVKNKNKWLDPLLAQWTKSFKIESQLTVPGVPKDEEERIEKIKLKLRLENMTVDSRFFVMDLAGHQVDPVVGDRSHPQEVAQSAEPRPALNAVDVKSYDVALKLHPTLINQNVQIGYLRGYLKNMDLGADQITLTKTPQFVFDQASDQQAKLKVSLEFPVTGAERMVFRGSVLRLSLEIIANLKISSEGVPTFYSDHIDESSIRIDWSNVRMQGIVKSKVEKKVLEKIRAANVKFKSQPSKLGTIKPPSLLGIAMDAIDFRVDQGNVVVFSTYR